MAKTQKIHYNLTEKTHIIIDELGSNYFEPHATKIASLTDSFSFLNLRDLARALNRIAKGK